MSPITKRKARQASLERVFRIRRENVRLLIKHYESRNNLARVLGCTAAFLTHIAGENPIRSIGEAWARGTEVKLNLPHGWFDIQR